MVYYYLKSIILMNLLKKHYNLALLSKAVTMLIERGCQFASKNLSGWTALDYSYSMDMKAHLQECARTHHEETKNSRRRNLKITVDSMISLDSIPITTRSATFPLAKPNVEL